MTLKLSGNVKYDENQVPLKCKLEMCQEDRVRTLSKEKKKRSHQNHH